MRPVAAAERSRLHRLCETFSSAEGLAVALVAAWPCASGAALRTMCDPLTGALGAATDLLRAMNASDEAADYERAASGRKSRELRRLLTSLDALFRRFAEVERDARDPEVLAFFSVHQRVLEMLKAHKKHERRSAQHRDRAAALKFHRRCTLAYQRLRVLR